MTMRLDPASSSPAFVQIAEQVRSRIASGIYRPGDLIPSIRETALQLLVNPNTVKRAYEELEREGFISSRKGVGMVVQESTARPARTQSAAAAQAVFVQGIRAAVRSGLARHEVDALYARAWAEAGRENKP